MPAIDFHGLERAISQLRTTLEYCGSDLAKQDAKLAQVFRAAAIQAFEFTYELSHKLLRRYLAETAPSVDAIIELSFPDLVRKGNARAVVSSDWKVWAEFRRLRSLTSHTYGESCAAELFAAIPGFVVEVEHLLMAMQKDPPR